jgi:hypothetical protein
MKPYGWQPISHLQIKSRHFWRRLGDLQGGREIPLFQHGGYTRAEEGLGPLLPNRLPLFLRNLFPAALAGIPCLVLARPA